MDFPRPSSYQPGVDSSSPSSSPPCLVPCLAPQRPTSFSITSPPTLAQSPPFWKKQSSLEVFGTSRTPRGDIPTPTPRGDVSARTPPGDVPTGIKTDGLPCAEDGFAVDGCAKDRGTAATAKPRRGATGHGNADGEKESERLPALSATPSEMWDRKWAEGWGREERRSRRVALRHSRSEKKHDQLLEQRNGRPSGREKEEEEEQRRRLAGDEAQGQSASIRTRPCGRRSREGEEPALVTPPAGANNVDVQNSNCIRGGGEEGEQEGADGGQGGGQGEVSQGGMGVLVDRSARDEALGGVGLQMVRSARDEALQVKWVWYVC